MKAGDRIPPIAVYIRDGWVCWICRKPINRRVKAPHLKAPSVDHVIPFNKGGLHTWDNVRCAHFGCNSYRGDRNECQLRLDFDE